MNDNTHEHLESRTYMNGGSSFESGVDEFAMAKIRRPYLLNGIQVWVTGESEQEVADKYADLKYAMTQTQQQHYYQPPVKKHNFKRFAQDNWQYISQTVSEGTNRDYKYYLDRDILPFFGKMDIEDIDWRSIQAFYDKLKHYSFSTVHKRKVVLSRILQIALGDGLISNDPTKDKRLTHTKKRVGRPVPDNDLYKQFLSDINSLEHAHERLYMALVGYTGLRRGEILALRWSDISFDKNNIRVTRAVNTRRTSEASPGLIKKPKTSSGIRTVPMIPALKQVLTSNKHKHDYIITDARTEEPLHTEARFNTMWRSIRRQINTGPYTSHSFRHAVCSTLLSSGVDVKTTQSILGHAQASTTLDIYAHAIPKNIAEAGLLFSGKLAI